jgi:hypothetical protein
MQYTNQLEEIATTEIENYSPEVYTILKAVAEVRGVPEAERAEFASAILLANSATVGQLFVDANGHILVADLIRLNSILGFIVPPSPDITILGMAKLLRRYAVIQ